MIETFKMNNKSNEENASQLKKEIDGLKKQLSLPTKKSSTSSRKSSPKTKTCFS